VPDRTGKFTNQTTILSGTFPDTSSIQRHKTTAMEPPANILPQKKKRGGTTLGENRVLGVQARRQSRKAVNVDQRCCLHSLQHSLQ